VIAWCFRDPFALLRGSQQIGADCVRGNARRTDGDKEAPNHLTGGSKDHASTVHDEVGAGWFGPTCVFFSRCATDGAWCDRSQALKLDAGISCTLFHGHHPELGAPAGGIRLPIAHATAWPTRAVQGNRALGATRSRAAGLAEHGEHGENATLPEASTLARSSGDAHQDAAQFMAKFIILRIRPIASM
jgi:hypothetical protein